MHSLAAIIFDWGDTLMRDFPAYGGPMAFWPRVELMPGVSTALEALSGHFICCVASNAGDSDSKLMKQALKRVGIDCFFAYLWTSRELGAAKPSPAFFLAAVTNLGILPSACAMVGNDLIRDIEPAKAIGMHTVWLADARSGAPSRRSATAADAVIRSREGLPEVIDRWTR